MPKALYDYSPLATGFNMQIDPILAAYSNPEIVNGFMDCYDVCEDEAKEIFEETKKWLWICAKARLARSTGRNNVPYHFSIVPSLSILDEMWHVFLLHTADYRFFCNEIIGTFVDHKPNGTMAEQIDKIEMASQISYVYDLLGEETVLLWYDTYATRYSDESMKRLRKPR